MLLITLLLCALLPSTLLAATKYVRPATDATGAALTYGAGDGSTLAKAFSGFAAMSGLAAGDTVCLPGSDEPFSNGDRLNTATAGTIGSPITWSGCGTTPFLIWNAQSLSGNRSFNSSRAVVSTSTYAWTTVATDIYRKRIDIRPQTLWEDGTWLQPVDIDAASEATILVTLTAGQWGVKNNGDATYRLYYKSTTSAKSPTTAVIRCDDITTSADSSGTGDTRVDVDYQTFSNGELRGYTGRAMGILDASNIILSTLSVTRSRLGYWVSGDATASHDVTFTNSSGTYADCTAGYFQGGAQGVTRLTINGGSWSNALGTYYNGTAFTACDGDGIGIGQAGGDMTDVVVRNVTANGNKNAGVFVGTSFAMTLTNFSLLSSIMSGNGANCFSEGATARIVHSLIISGFLCTGTLNTTNGSAMRFAPPQAARTIIVANGTFAGNFSPGRISFRPDVDNNYQFLNLVFTNNPGWTSGNVGDLYSQNLALIGDEVFRNIYFYSAPNLAKRFATLAVAGTAYLYNVGGDLAAFNTATGATGTVINTDPLLISTSDLRTQTTSPLRRAGIHTDYCIDLGGGVCWPTPDIGAYQLSSGTAASARAAATTRSTATTRRTATTRATRQ